MELIVFSGIQGAGKTTFFLQRFASTHVRVGLDLLRTRNREDILLYACLAAQQAVVIDNTNPTAAQRARYAAIGKAAGFRTSLHFFDVPLDDALARNAKRSGTQCVPEIGIRGTAVKLERPTAMEPFDEILNVTVGPAGEWHIEVISREIR